MKAGWRVEPLGGLAVISYGYTAKASSEPVGPKFLRITDIQDNTVDWESVPHCSISSVEHKRHALKNGDIVFARTGATTGKSFLIKSPPDAVCASYLIKLRVEGSEDILPEYLSAFFQTAQYWQAVEQGTEGAAQGGFNASKLAALPIPLPPLDEQKRIVAILDEAFEGLSRARANAQANLADAQELFESTLRGVFQGIEMRAPKHTLAAVARTFGRGKSRHRPRNDPKLYGGNYPFVQTGDIRNSDGVVTAFSQTYNDLGLAQSKLWPEGTVCITIAANIAETAILGFPACFPDSIIGMVCEPEKVSAEYIELMLRYFAADLKEQGKGSAQDNINLATFERSLFPIPGISEQARIVEQLYEIAQERRNLTAHFLEVIASLDTLRQSLLQKAFSGELT